MENAIEALCATLRKLYLQLKPINSGLSFTLIVGRHNQGKSTLLRQSNLQHISTDTDPAMEIYYNQNGIIVELNESWLNYSKPLLQNSLKKLNRCHTHLKITGILLCIDINEFFNSNPGQLAETVKTHSQLLQRFGHGLGYTVDLGIILTKLDGLAGFCEFYQNEHVSDLKNPLGFSLTNSADKNTLIKHYRKQFEQMIELLNQLVITKIHPVRSGIKRTLIREFPMQLASLRVNMQFLIQALPLPLFKLQALYFTSAEQGGLSQDRLISKIKHEYALTVQDKFHQSVNYRPFFIDGALDAFQKQTQQQLSKSGYSQKWAAGILSGIVGLSLAWLALSHFKSSRLLDEASKELLMYETVARQPNDAAEFYLSNASQAIERIGSNSFSMPTIQQLKSQLRVNTQHQILGNFLPTALNEIEQVMTDPNSSPIARYQALRVYLMLSDPARFSHQDVMAWYETKWSQLPEAELNKRFKLLREILHEPMQSVVINQQLVNDTRNYLNALPSSYLYYSLAKSHFSPATSPIIIEGFLLSNDQLPAYFTKAGFAEIIKQIPAISQSIQQENWVLSHQEIDNLPLLIQQTYCYDYVTWWQNFISKSQPTHVQDYKQAHQLASTLLNSNSMPLLVKFIQQQTSPGFDDSSALFNQEIASQFTQLNLLGQSALNDLTTNLKELEVFLNTLSMITDNGKAAFTLARARYNGDQLANPLSALFNRSQQLPEPISNWTNQIAGEFWYLLIKDSRNYINQQWQELVYSAYKNQIEGRFPFDPTQQNDVSITDFEHFFGSHGLFNQFIEAHVKPFLDTSNAQWQPKELNNYVLPITSENLDEIMRANVINYMFFPARSDKSHIEFSLQKISLDPIVANLQLKIGDTVLKHTQETESFIRFTWPQFDAMLSLNSIEGNHYELDETGPWAFFKILQKVNVLADEQDSSRLQILFEVNGNSGRYILKTHNQINPFIPGILSGFTLPKELV